jgi:hypothetical protein
MLQVGAVKDSRPISRLAQTIMGTNLEHTIEGFIETLRCSSLIDEAQLQHLVEEFWSVSHPFGATLTSFTSFLIGRQILTGWQVAKLRERKFKGYFLDQFVLLDHVDSSSDSSRYLARDRTSGRLVIVTVSARGLKVFETTRYDVEEM